MGSMLFHDSVKDHVTPLYLLIFLRTKQTENEFTDMRQYAFEQYNKGYGIYDLLWLDRYNGNGELNISRDLYTKGHRKHIVRGDWNSKDGMYFFRPCRPDRVLSRSWTAEHLYLIWAVKAGFSIWARSMTTFREVRTENAPRDIIRFV